MRVSLITLNCKYSHTSLALRCLRNSVLASGMECVLSEYTINQPKEEILQLILEHPADVYAFSVYIYNIRETEAILSDLRSILSDVPILCGGPEVSYGCKSFLVGHPEVDAVLRGEGEATLPEVLRAIERAPGSWKDVLHTENCAGVAFFQDRVYVETPERLPVCNLDLFPFPYQEGELPLLKDRILYYETSRGCPYTCIYCLSSVQGKVRSRSLELVFEELQQFLDAGVRVVKFVDRTFNFDRNRATAIWRFLKEHDNGITSFHFEIAAWLLSEEQFLLLNSFRPGMILLEIGIQSLNPETIRAVTRKGDPQILCSAVRRLSAGPCHVHADLIAGLPYEDLVSFRRSFDQVLSLCPDCLQLGFLKVLKGTALENRREDGAVYSQFPPYEIVKNNWLSPSDLSVLKRVERVLEWYWNSGLCRTVLTYYIRKKSDGMFSFWEGLAESFRNSGKLWCSHRPEFLFQQMFDYLKFCFPENLSVSEALLSFDRFSFSRISSPAPWQKTLPDRDRLNLLLKSGRIPELLTEQQRNLFSAMTPPQWFRNAELVLLPCTPDGTLEPHLRLFLYGSLRISLPIPVKFDEK